MTYSFADFDRLMIRAGMLRPLARRVAYRRYIASGMVRESGHLLTWVGPPKE